MSSSPIRRVIVGAIATVLLMLLVHPAAQAQTSRRADTAEPAAADQTGQAPTKTALDERIKAGRIATYNTCNPCEQDSGRWQQARNIAGDIAWMANYKGGAPEVVGIQETCVATTRLVQRILRDDYGLTYHIQHGSVLENFWRCGGTPWNPGNYGNAILSASPVSGATVEEYPEGGSEDRGYVSVTTNLNGAPTRIFNTHLAQAGQAAVRTEQVKVVRDRASAYPGAILLGDFNATADAAELVPLWAFYNDADPKCSPSSAANCTATHPGAKKKFDYVWLDKQYYTPTNIQTMDTFSDHDLVYTDLAP